MQYPNYDLNGNFISNVRNNININQNAYNLKNTFHHYRFPPNHHNVNINFSNNFSTNNPKAKGNNNNLSMNDGKEKFNFHKSVSSTKFQFHPTPSITLDYFYNLNSKKDSEKITNIYKMNQSCGDVQNFNSANYYYNNIGNNLKVSHLLNDKIQNSNFIDKRNKINKNVNFKITCDFKNNCAKSPNLSESKKVEDMSKCYNVNYFLGNGCLVQDNENSYLSIHSIQENVKQENNYGIKNNFDDTKFDKELASSDYRSSPMLNKSFNKTDFEKHLEYLNKHAKYNNVPSKDDSSINLKDIFRHNQVLENLKKSDLVSMFFNSKDELTSDNQTKKMKLFNLEPKEDEFQADNDIVLEFEKLFNNKLKKQRQKKFVENIEETYRDDFGDVYGPKKSN